MAMGKGCNESVLSVFGCFGVFKMTSLLKGFSDSVGGANLRWQCKGIHGLIVVLGHFGRPHTSWAPTSNKLGYNL